MITNADGEVCLSVLMQNCPVERTCVDCRVQLVTRHTELCLQTVVIKGSAKIGQSVLHTRVACLIERLMFLKSLTPICNLRN